MFCRQGKLSFKKVKKIRNFPKGLVHGFCQKLAFSTFFSLKVRQKRLLPIILERRECFLDKKN